MKTRILLTSFIDEILYKIVIENRHVSDAVDMPDSWYRTIRFLDKNQPVTMHKIAQFLHVSTPRATIIGNALVEKGYIKRINGTDRRNVYIRLTKKGNDIIDATTQVHQHLSEHILEPLTPTERDNLYKLLLKCTDVAKNVAFESSIDKCELMQKNIK